MDGRQVLFGLGGKGASDPCLDAVIVEEPKNDVLWKMEDQSVTAILTLFVAVTSIILFFTEIFCMLLRRLHPPRFVAGVIVSAFYQFH